LEQFNALCIVLIQFSDRLNKAFKGCYSVSKEPRLTLDQCIFVLL